MIRALVSWCVIGIAFTAVAWMRVARARRRAQRLAPGAALVLRPLDAPSPAELDNLAAHLPGAEQVIVSPWRPARASGRWLPSRPRALNRKLGHLQLALSTLELGAAPVLSVDADVRVDGPLIGALLGALADGADLAWAAPHPCEPGAIRGLLVQSLHSFEVLDALGPGAKPICGKAMALSPRAQAALEDLPDCIGEDLELSQVLHRQGLRVQRAGVARMSAASPPRAALARFTRWMQVLRAHRPALFPSIPVLFTCTPPLLGAAALTRSTSLAVAVAVLVAARTALASFLERRAGIRLDWLKGEALLLAAWLGALALGPQVTWRGRRLRVGPHGRLLETTASAVRGAG